MLAEAKIIVDSSAANRHCLLTASTNPVEIDGIKKEHDMLHANEPALQVKNDDGTWAYVFCYMHNRQDPATCRVTGTTCRPNVRSGSIEAVPTWVIVLGWIVAMVGITVIGVTW